MTQQMARKLRPGVSNIYALLPWATGVHQTAHSVCELVRAFRRKGSRV